MPYKTGEFKGELTAAEIRKLIRGHNKLVSLKIPRGLDRNGLIKFLKRNKYEVDHKNQKLINKVPSRYTQVSLERAERITKRKPQAKQTKPEKKEPEKKKVEAIKVTKGKKKSINLEPTDKEEKKKPEKKKISKELKESIQYGVNLEDNKYNLDKDACKLFMFAAKKLIQADKDNFKKVRLFTNDEMPSRLDGFGKNIAMGDGTPSPLLRLYDFLTPASYEWWENTIRQVKNDCGVKEAIFVETAYDILYRKYDQIKEILLKQNKKFNKEKLEKFIERSKPKKIDYLYYEKK